MHSKEIYTLFILNIIFTLRMLGIFMILPVLSTYGMKLNGANPSLIGIAIGIYGAMQIIFQIPLGLASDKFGRKPIIIGGLLISALGTSIAALTNNIWGIIVGRSLQGTSAISGTLIALISDLIKEKNKTIAMMLLGLNFSLTFAVSIILGPIFTDLVGLQGLFWIITLLTLLGIIFSLFYLPSSDKYTKHYYNIQTIINYKISKTTNQSQLIKINCGIFFLHTILILNFMILPQIMNSIQLLAIEQSKIYFLNVLITLIISTIAILYFEKKRNIKKLLVIAIYILFLSEIILFLNTKTIISLILSSTLFFIAFNLIEGILPSMLTKIISKSNKGMTAGIFSTCQFLGTTLGGILGGYLLHKYNNLQIILYLEMIITTIWIIMIISLKEPPYVN